MPLSLKVTPGYQFGDDERLTQVKLNQLGRPTIELQGALASSAIAPGSITSDKLSPSLITGLTAADPEKIDLLMFHDVSANGLRQTTIDKILALSTPSLPTIAAVELKDFAWIIQSQDGANKKATIADTLREVINQQTPLPTTPEIDPVADQLLLFDASAASGTNRNRKASVGVTIKTVTNTLIADAPVFSGILDKANDELLLRDASLTVGTQQVRVKLQDLLAQAGGIKAWARINTNLTRSFVDCTWVAAQDIITTATPHSLSAGDFIWFNDTYNQAPQVAAFTAYYVFPLNSTTLQLYSTKAAALAQTASQRIDIPVDTSAKKYTRWSGNPIVASSNISACVTTRSSPNDIGYYRVFFELPLLNPNYAIQLTASYYDGDHDQQGLSASVNIAGSRASPSATSNPTTGLFDLLVRNISGNDPAAPDILSVTVFQ